MQHAIKTSTPSSLWAVSTIYTTALIQGLTLVSFPASGTFLKSALAFTDAHYGSIFIPQVISALLGSLIGASIQHKTGLRALLIAMLFFNGVSQLLLTLSPMFSHEISYIVILAATASLGLGFGLGGAPINILPSLLFPARKHTAVVALHSVLGLGLALGPFLISSAISANVFTLAPIFILSMCLVFLVFALFVKFPTQAATSHISSQLTTTSKPHKTFMFWAFVLIAILYAFAEGTFSNWVVIYLAETKGFAMDVATLALALFWFSLVAGRLLVTALVLRIAPKTIWLSMPVLMILAFLLIPTVSTPLAGILFFILAGLACSAFFPLTVTLATEYFHEHSATIASLMIAALMIGVGSGSFLIGLMRHNISLQTLYGVSIVYPGLILLVMLLSYLSAKKRGNVHTANIA